MLLLSQVTLRTIVGGGFRRFHDIAAKASAATTGPAATNGPIPGIAIAPMPTSQPSQYAAERRASACACRDPLRGFGIDLMREIPRGTIPVGKNR